MDSKENDIKEQYINAIQLSNSVYEVRMEFYVETPNEDMSEILKRKVSDIRLAPQLAKELIGLLTNVVNAYEENIGEIPLARKVNQANGWLY